MEKLKLIDPRFLQVIELETKPDIWLYLCGPFCVARRDSWWLGMRYLFFTILSVGIFWFFIPRIFIYSKIAKMLEQGYKPATSDDAFLINMLKIRYTEVKNNPSIGRLSSGDDMFGKR
ncbi:MAG: hypothetical protein KAQ98_06495 [Bacteriovoracaceae bacterium]|nr:hypothetical protein [Bacteriovoracaceae bacterium]